MADVIALIYLQSGTGFKRYWPGDIVPADEPMAAEWLKTGAALLREGDPPEFVYATLMTAEPGLPGTAVGGEGAPVNLVGQIPETQQRKRQ